MATGDKPQQTPAELEASLLARVVGQESSLRELTRAYTRFKAGLSPTGRPAGTFLLIGPTGSGKSHLATTFAKAITGSADSPLRIDCGEFVQSHEVAKLIGSPPGYLGHRETAALLSANVLKRQHTSEQQLAVVLFDEIDKAHPKLWDLLLGILDGGKLTLGDNTTVDFTNTFILMTGNTGSRAVAEAANPSWGLGPKDGSSTTAKTQGSKSAESAARRLLRPEAFNRIDKVLVFDQLDMKSIEAILCLELEDLQGRLASRGISLDLTEGVRSLICNDGLDLRYGARHLKRSLVRHVELALADEIVAGTVPNGSDVQARLKNGAVIFKVT